MSVAELSDEEWREFQSIPEQGYSHRHWINQRIAAALEALTANGEGERELLAKILCGVSNDYEIGRAFRSADAILAAGFRLQPGNALPVSGLKGHLLPVSGAEDMTATAAKCAGFGSYECQPGDCAGDDSRDNS